VTYEGLHGRWQTANSDERGAAWTAWNARNKKGNGALHLGVVKQTTTERHGGADRRRRSRRRPLLEDGGGGGCSSPAAWSSGERRNVPGTGSSRRRLVRRVKTKKAQRRTSPATTSFGGQHWPAVGNLWWRRLHEMEGCGAQADA
jgi:hypothetical protein